MSLLKKCDICGKNESQKKVTFTNGDLKLKIPNHKNELYNVFVSIRIEHEKDTKTLDKLYGLTQEPEYGYEDIVEGDEESFGGDDNKVFEQLLLSLCKGKEKGILVKFNTPSPCICDNCKRELMKLSISYGKYKDFMDLS